MYGLHDYSMSKEDISTCKNGSNIRAHRYMRPGTPVPVIILNNEGEYEVQMRIWGLLRYWSESSTHIRIHTLFNAKSESNLLISSLQNGCSVNRCIIPMSAKFEYQRLAEISRRVNCKNYTPALPRFCVAGIYEDVLEQNTGKLIKCFSILTTEIEMHSTSECLNTTPFLQLNHVSYDMWLRGTTQQARKLLLATSSEVNFASIQDK